MVLDQIRKLNILNGKWDKHVLASMRNGDRLLGSLVRNELLVICLLSCMSWDAGYLLMEHRVSVHLGDDPGSYPKYRNEIEVRHRSSE